MEVTTSYKHTKVGRLPASWDVVKLGAIATLSSGTTPLRSKHDAYFKGGDIHWVKTKDLTNASILETEELVTEQALNETSLSIYPEGTVLIAMYGGFNQIGRTGLLEIPATVNQAITAIQADSSKVIPQYLIGYLNYKVDYWKNVAVSSRKDPNITARDVSRFPLALPPLPEQRAIADALSDVDALIEKLDALITKKRDIKTATMQRLLTGEQRLPGFDGGWDGSYKHTNAGNIPTDWKAVRVDEIGDVRGGKRLPKGRSLTSRPTPYPYIRVSDMKAEGVNVANVMYVPEDVFPTIKNYRILSSDVYISVAGTLGLVGKVPAELDGANLTENADRITNLKCDQDYLIAQLLSNRIQNEIDSVKTVGAQPKLALGRIESFLIPLPPRDEQRAIAEVLTDMDAEVEALQARRDKTQAIKQGMMQELLTGRTRLV